MFGQTKTTTGEAVPVRTSEKSLMLRSPREELAQIHDQMDRLISRFFVSGIGSLPRSGSARLSGDILNFEPAIDLYETDKAIKLFAEVPGYQPDQITVETTGDTFTITGERKALYNEDKASSQRTGSVVSAGRFRVSGMLPGEIDPEKAKATFKNGILELEMPKTEQVRPAAVKVPVNA